MRSQSARLSLLLGVITSAPLVALTYLGNSYASLPFPPFSLLDWLARVLPGNIVTLAIDGMVDVIVRFNLGQTDVLGKYVEQAVALAIFVLLTVVGSWSIHFGVRNVFKGHKLEGGMLVGVFLAVVFLLVEARLNRLRSVFISSVWMVGIMTVWGGIVSWLLVMEAEMDLSSDGRKTRRDILKKLSASAAGLTILAGAFGRALTIDQQSSGADESLPDSVAGEAGLQLQPEETIPSRDNVADLETPGSHGRDAFVPTPDTRSEITPNEEFYRIDINMRPPTISSDEWRLTIEGLFADPRALSLDDLWRYPAVERPATLSCISNRIGGDLIGTSIWTGVRLADVMDDLGLMPEARALVVRASDGFHETVEMADLKDPRTLLVYGMNGQTLPVEHGFPLRILIPNRYGMKQPKWITEIIAVSDVEPGYWVIRGWSEQARPQIISVIDEVAADQPLEDGRIPIGGIAWAGDRGIATVEVKIDEGNWQQVALRAPPLSESTWVQWRLDWTPVPGRHLVTVRATDGSGVLQTEERQGVRPDGATGYHSTRFRV